MDATMTGRTALTTATKAICLMAVGSLSGCAIANADMANKTRLSMVGMSKETLVSCMGIPSSSGVVGNLEVWKYHSGGGSVSSGSSYGNATANLFGNMVTSYASGSSFSSTQARYCVINVTMREGRVASVKYSGPSGGLLTKGSECAYAIENCSRPEDRVF